MGSQISFRRKSGSGTKEVIFEVGLETKLKSERCTGEIYGLRAEKVSEGNCEIRGTSGQVWSVFSLPTPGESLLKLFRIFFLHYPQPLSLPNSINYLYQKAPI